jgi:hypothetical protein
MANSFAANVWIVDTDGAFPMGNNARVCGVRLMGGTAASTLVLKKGSSSGAVLLEMEAAIDTNVYEQVEINTNGGLYADIGGAGAKAYIYFK